MAAFSVTAAFVSWLASKGYQAHTYPPATGDEFVTVERTGGYVEDLVDKPSISIQAWAATEPRAEEMANAIRLLLATGDLPAGVYRASVNSGPYRFYDEDTRLPRYQLYLDAVCQLTE